MHINDRGISNHDDASSSSEIANAPDLVCFSHLRWDFVYQRPQHLMSRCARRRRVFFIEEPIFDRGPLRLEVKEREGGVCVCVPHLPEGLTSEVARDAVQQSLIERLFADRGIRDYVLWYYTPMALSFTRQLRPLATVYDCMDELSAFRGASPQMRACEEELLACADLVFTGGQSLNESKELPACARQTLYLPLSEILLKWSYCARIMDIKGSTSTYHPLSP